MSELYLVRHAQASFGGDNYDELSELGYQQSEYLGKYFLERDITFGKMVCGSMQRHSQTLDGICKGMDLTDFPNYEVFPGLNEYDFLDMSESFGKQFPDDELYLDTLSHPGDRKVYYRLLRKVLSSWCAGEIDEVKETWPSFRKRVESVLQLFLKMSEPGVKILAVSSGGAISTYIGVVLNLSPETIFELNLQMKNTAISHFYFNSEKIMLSSFNNIPHLDQLQRLDKITYA